MDAVVLSRASESAFGMALRAGEVRSISFDGQRKYGLEIATGSSAGVTSFTGSGEVLNPLVIWQGSNGRLYRTDLTHLRSLPDPAGSPSRVDVLSTIALTTAAAGVPLPALGSIGLLAFLGWPLIVLLVVALLMLIVGPQPRRMTKWGWC